jgi:hypothetical protein
MRVPKSVIDLLREQPEETLLEMQASIRADLERLSVELQQVEEALGKKGRRRKASGSGTANGRSSGVSRETVYEVVRASAKPMKPSEVKDALQAQGIVTTTNAMRTSLARLREQGRLESDEDNRFSVPFTLAPMPEIEADSPLSRVNQPHSHG